MAGEGGLVGLVYGHLLENYLFLFMRNLSATINVAMVVKEAAV